MGINNAILSYFPKLQEKDKGSFFLNIFVLLQIVGFIIAIIVYFTYGFSLAENNLIFNKKIILLLSIYIFLYSPTLIIETKYIIQKSYNELLKYGIAIYLLQFTLVLITIILFHDMHYVLASMVVWIGARWLWTILFILRDISTINVSMKLIKIFILFALPIIAHILLGNGMEFIDGILVEKNFESSMFSIYRYGAREFPIILILIGALRSVMIPEAVENSVLAAEKIKRKTKKLILLFFPLAIVLIFISKYIFIAFYNEDYGYSALLFNIYLLIISSRIILSEVFIYAKHKNKILMYVSFIELILNVGLSLILMRFYGIAGIAFATFIAFLISKIYLAFYTQRVLGLRLKDYLDLKVYLFFTTLLYLSFVIELII